MRDEQAYSEVGWCNNWVSLDGEPKIHQYEAWDEPGVEDAVPALVGDLALEGPVPLSECNVGEVVLVPMPFHQRGMVQCHAAVLGEQTIKESGAEVEVS